MRVSQPYVASAAASPTSVLRGMVVGSNPRRARWSLLHHTVAETALDAQPSSFERRCLTALEQARCLIELATDPNILGRAWRGLQTFI